MFRKWMRKPSRFHTKEYRGIKKNMNEKGGITIEATLFLTMFIMFYMFFIYLVQMTKAQVVLQYSINEVAKEVSAYSYVLTKVGITEKRAETSESANKFKGDTMQLVNGVQNLANLISSEDTGLIDKVNGLKEEGTELIDNGKAYKESYLSDKTTIFYDLLDVAKSGVVDWASAALIGEIVEREVAKQIEVMSHKDADTYLKDLGVVDGLEGLDFSKTKWASEIKEGMPVFEVTVTYEMKMNLGWFELEPRKYKLTAKTALW